MKYFLVNHTNKTMSEISDTSDDTWCLVTKQSEELVQYKDQHDGRMEKAYEAFLQLEYKIVSLDEINHTTEEMNTLYIKSLARKKSARIELQKAEENTRYVASLIDKYGIQLTDYTKQWIKESEEV